MWFVAASRRQKDTDYPPDVDSTPDALGIRRELLNVLRDQKGILACWHVTDCLCNLKVVKQEDKINVLCISLEFTFPKDHYCA